MDHRYGPGIPPVLLSCRLRLDREMATDEINNGPSWLGSDQLDVKRMERVMGIEPTYSAWKAAALPLSYTRIGREEFALDD